jgi:ABC-type phosphate transport system auxiliary subunit
MTLGAALLVGTGVALASPSAAPEIARVEAIYEQAQQVGGGSAAPVEMQSAQMNLERARETAHKGDNDAAARLAERAEVDATLAMAKAREQAAQDSARQVQQGLTTLRTELNRDARQLNEMNQSNQSMSAPPAPAYPAPSSGAYQQ